MYVSGFTFLRNGEKLGYPYLEALRSILPVVDELVVALGPCDDDTEAQLLALGTDKLRIVHTIWDDSLREGGRTYALETDKAMDACNPKADWLFYIQGDEVIHEQYLPAIRHAMQQHLADKGVEGLLFNYLHFYGDYKHIAISRFWYHKEVRIIRQGIGIRSYKDAQGFRRHGEKLWVKPIAATVYHYGWVKEPEVMHRKNLVMQRYWHDDETVERMRQQVFEYEHQPGLQPFKGTHPEVMLPRVQSQHWNVKFAPRKEPVALKYRLLHWVEMLTGHRLWTYANYRIRK